MKVFITGATGYIGLNVAMAYRRAGHEVWGLTRSEEKARLLSRHEIRPVVGSMQQPEGWGAAAKDCSVLIHAAVDYQTDPFALDKQTVEFLLSLAQQGPRPKTLIYTSGVWVYGNTQGSLVDETQVEVIGAGDVQQPAVQLAQGWDDAIADTWGRLEAESPVEPALRCLGRLRIGIARV